jgi:preprotein translocase subunit SecG
MGFFFEGVDGVMFPVLFAASFWHYFFGIVLFLTSLFLILLVLVQRGRGGGLTGALGGMGGQSAFGAKAGDTFTRVTMVTATLWILMCMAAIKFLGSDDRFGAGRGPGTGVNMTMPGADDSEDWGGPGVEPGIDFGGLLDEGPLDSGVDVAPGDDAATDATDSGENPVPED